VEKYVTAGQATDGSITRRMRFAGWITKATDTQQYVILLFECDNDHKNAPQSYVYTHGSSLVKVASS
jgi:hypothetical protein